jgi:hypothetical protein
LKSVFVKGMASLFCQSNGHQFKKFITLFPVLSTTLAGIGFEFDNLILEVLHLPPYHSGMDIFVMCHHVENRIRGQNIIFTRSGFAPVS